MKFDFFPMTLHLSRPYNWAKGAHTLKNGVLICVRDDVGNSLGWGEIAPPPDGAFVPKKVIEDALILIRELDPLAPDFIERLDQRKPENRIRNGLVSAALTARAWQRGVPLGELLSPHQAALSTRLNGYLGAVPSDTAIQRATMMFNQGIRTIKVKCTEDYMADFKRVSEVARELPELKFRLDPNGSWQNIDIFAAFKKFSTLPIEYVEEPIPFSPNNKILKELIKILPLAADHWGCSVQELDILADSEMLSIVILKSQIMGGPDKTVEIAGHAHSRAIPAIVTASLETLVGITIAQHCATAIPTRHLEHGLYLWDFFNPNATHYPDVHGGAIALPASTPGLGFSPLFTLSDDGSVQLACTHPC